MARARGTRRAGREDLPQSVIELFAALLVGREPVLGSWRKTCQLVCLISVPPLLIIISVGVALKVIGVAPTAAGAVYGVGGGLLLTASARMLLGRLGIVTGGGNSAADSGREGAPSLCAVGDTAGGEGRNSTG
jgi:hypothetical protein